MMEKYGIGKAKSNNRKARFTIEEHPKVKLYKRCLNITIRCCVISKVETEFRQIKFKKNF